jgi:hypothetical protein
LFRNVQNTIKNSILTCWEEGGGGGGKKGEDQTKKVHIKMPGDAKKNNSGETPTDTAVAASLVEYRKPTTIN